MFIEVVAIGDEILSGATINTNASSIGRHLGKDGWKVSRQTTLGDEYESLKNGLHECLQRSDVVIATGGLGPTLDDITERAAEALCQIEPKIIPNPVGSASGFLYEDTKSKHLLFLLPGVPLEMEAMLLQSVIPILKEKFPLPKKTFQEEFYFCQLSENKVDPILRELKQVDPEISLGIYPGYGILTVRVTSSTLQSLERAKTKLLQAFGKNAFTAKNCQIQEAVHDWFIKHNQTLACAESCTGGLLATHITALAGASQYFLGSIVAYSNALKETLLGVSSETLASAGAVSSQTVTEMLSGLFNKTNAGFGIAVSGIAGPTGGTLEKPVGTVFYALGKQGEKPEVGSFCAKGNRQIVMLYTTNILLGKLLKVCE